jgi:hypothetical protein
MERSDPLLAVLVAVEVAAELLDEAAEKRNLAVLAAIEAGCSYRQVAGAARVTHPTITRIVRDYMTDTEPDEEQIDGKT